MSATPSRIAAQGQELHDIIDAIVLRASRAAKAARSPSRSRSELGTIITGNTSSDSESLRTWSDPTGDAAMRLLDLLEAVSMSLGVERQNLYAITATLVEFADHEPPDNGVRRCNKRDCARKHYATGLCKMHYDREDRADKRAAVRAAGEGRAS